MAQVKERDSRSMKPVAATRRATTEDSPLLIQEDTVSEDSKLSVHVANTSRCKTLCARRSAPKGKGLLLLLFVYFMESLAFYSATKGIRELLNTLLKEDVRTNTWSSVLCTLIFNTFGRLLYPFAGILADSFLGRYKVIEIGLWLVSCGMILICVSLSIIDQVSYSLVSIILPVFCIILIATGTACVEVNTVSFGVDQLTQGCTSEQISSYFFWYNFIRNVSLLLGIGLGLGLSYSRLYLNYDTYLYSDHSKTVLVDLHYKVLIVMVIATTAAVIGLFIHVVKHHWYFKNTQRDNPVKTVLNVTWFSMTVKRHAPIYRRAFRYGEARQPRIELAKIEYDGIFEAETVENVKTFYQILLLIISLGGFFASNGAVYSMLSSQFEIIIKCVSGGSSSSYNSLAPYLIALINSATIVVFVPIMNHAVLPFCYTFSVSLRFRLGVGQLLNFLAVLIAVLLQDTAEATGSISDIAKLLWLFLPAITLSIGESLTFVTGLEFIYAQAPESMKGLLYGLFYFMFGLSGGIVSVVFYYFPSDMYPDCQITGKFTLWFYLMFASVSVLGLLFYTLVACLYRNRRRPAEDEDDLVRRIYAQNVFGN